MRYYYGTKRKKKYFEGWYLKHQTNKESIAFIIGVQLDKKKNKSAFIQIITDNNSYHIDYDFNEFYALEDRFYVRIGENEFSRTGIEVNIETSDISVKGKIGYGDFTRLNYDIMGPLIILPFMECKHGILSMGHELNGILTINNSVINFDNGLGYIEKDYGKSFPKKYLWTQCNNFAGNQCMITAACATIPYLGLTFSGFFCVINYNDLEYRFATYLGGKVLISNNNYLLIKQRKYRLIVELLNDNAKPLKAPINGTMHRIIHESLSCKVRYCLYKHNKLLFDLTSDCASFEFSQDMG